MIIVYSTKLHIYYNNCIKIIKKGGKVTEINKIEAKIAFPRFWNSCVHATEAKVLPIIEAVFMRPLCKNVAFDRNVFIVPRIFLFPYCLCY